MVIHQHTEINVNEFIMSKNLKLSNQGNESEQYDGEHSNANTKNLIKADVLPILLSLNKQH